MNVYSDKLRVDGLKKEEVIYGYDYRIWRKDFGGAWIRYDHYGIKDSYGWEIDHKKPKAQGGTDDIRNLQPLQWKNNLEKSDNYPFFSTKITSRGNENVEESQSWQIIEKRRE